MFVNPLLLFGLALLSAPVIIHILNKRRYRVQDWAAMDYLLAAQVSNRRRVKFEDLILLLLRMAIIGFLVMACLLYTSPSPRDSRASRMPSYA